MKFQEYPKALYRGEEFTTVDDAEQEKAQRADGWHDAWAQPDEAQEDGKRGGRQAKSK